MNQQNSVDISQAASLCLSNIKTMEQSQGSLDSILHFLCSYCEFSTDNKNDLVTHMHGNHMKPCSFCSFRSLSQADLTKHVEYEHGDRFGIACSSNAGLDRDPMSMCEFCSFMTYSTELLQKHTYAEHTGMQPKHTAEWILKTISAKVRKADAMFYSSIIDEASESEMSGTGKDALDSEPGLFLKDIRVPVQGLQSVEGKDIPSWSEHPPSTHQNKINYCNGDDAFTNNQSQSLIGNSVDFNSQSSGACDPTISRNLDTNFVTASANAGPELNSESIKKDKNVGNPASTFNTTYDRESQSSLNELQESITPTTSRTGSGNETTLIPLCNDHSISGKSPMEVRASSKTLKSNKLSTEKRESKSKKNDGDYNGGNGIAGGESQQIKLEHGHNDESFQRLLQSLESDLMIGRLNMEIKAESSGQQSDDAMSHHSEPELLSNDIREPEQGLPSDEAKNISHLSEHPSSTHQNEVNYHNVNDAFTNIQSKSLICNSVSQFSGACDPTISRNLDTNFVTASANAGHELNSESIKKDKNVGNPAGTFNTAYDRESQSSLNELQESSTPTTSRTGSGNETTLIPLCNDHSVSRHSPLEVRASSKTLKSNKLSTEKRESKSKKNDGDYNGGKGVAGGESQQIKLEHGHNDESFQRLLQALESDLMIGRLNMEIKAESSGQQSDDAMSHHSEPELLSNDIREPEQGIPSVEAKNISHLLDHSYSTHQNEVSYHNVNDVFTNIQSKSLICNSVGQFSGACDPTISRNLDTNFVTVSASNAGPELNSESIKKHQNLSHPAGTCNTTNDRERQSSLNELQLQESSTPTTSKTGSGNETTLILLSNDYLTSGVNDDEPHLLFSPENDKEMREDQNSTSNMPGKQQDSFPSVGDLKAFHPCNQCSLTFSTSTLLEEHTAKQHKEEDTVMITRSKRCYVKRTFPPSQLAESQTNKSPVIPPKCKRVNREQKRPTRAQGSETPFKCEKCGKCFTNIKTLRCHMTILHTRKKRNFSCYECGRKFTRLSCLRAHQKLHYCEEEFQCFPAFKCEKCGKCFKSSNTLHCHKTIHTGEKKFSCDECGRKFRWRSHLQRHEKLHSGERKHKCTLCSKSFIQGYDLVLHMRGHTGERPYKCSYCDKGFKCKQGLKTHTVIHTRDEPYKCVFCNKSYAHSSSRDIHVRSHITQMLLKQAEELRETSGADPSSQGNQQNRISTEKPRISRPRGPQLCRECGKVFQPGSLCRHLLSQMGVRQYKCSKCGNNFVSEFKLKKHVSKFHPEERQYQCNMCEKNYKTVAALKRHNIRSHTEEKPFKCTECDKRFKFVNGLKRHIGTHTGEKPFKCTECDKCYRSKESLNAHMSIHTGEQRLLCSICGKNFRWNAHLRRHLKIHSGEKPYKCTVCGMHFGPKDDLQKHMTIHTEKLYKCSLCAKTFRSNSAYQNHVSQFLGGQLHSCTMCDKTYHGRVSLQQHIQKIHNMDASDTTTLPSTMVSLM